jgi:hypothetical protein
MISSLVSGLPPEGVAYFTKVYNDSLERQGDDVLAFEVAWSSTKSLMREEGGVLVANSVDFLPSKVYSFSLEPAEEVIIKNHSNGDVELDAVMATTEPRVSDGASFTEEALVEMAEQINKFGSTFPDVDHETISRLEKQYAFDVDGLAAALKREKGIMSSIKAVVRDGKLWIKAFLDKRYHRFHDRFKNLSIEAAAKKTKDNKLVSPRYLGFTFTNTPQLVGAEIAR